MDAFKFTHRKGHHLIFSLCLYLRNIPMSSNIEINVCILEHIKGLQVTIE